MKWKQAKTGQRRKAGRKEVGLGSKARQWRSKFAVVISAHLAAHTKLIGQFLVASD